MKGLFGSDSFIFLMARTKMLAPVRMIGGMPSVSKEGTRHMTRVMCSFLAGVPVNIVCTLMMNGICLIKDRDQVLCVVCPDQARRLPIPLSPCLGEIAEPDSDNSHADQEQADLEECAGLFLVSISPTTRPLFKLIQQDLPSCNRSR
jgi:hypothetical protein